MKNKTVVITGGNDGIGYQTALQLARLGANVIIIGRNEEKTKQAYENIQAEPGAGKAHDIIADLSVMKNIRRAAAEIRGITDKVDVLINNAGGVFTNFELTEDGLEKSIATNHFAYFLLTGLLLDLIKKSDDARIINVSSDAHYNGKIDFDSFTSNKSYNLFIGYRQNKLANILFTYELAERLKNTQVTVNSLHPGTVKTKLANKAGFLIGAAWSLVTLFSMSPAKGAKTSVFLATDESVKNITGRYFSNCKQVEPHPAAHDKDLRKKLWEVSEKLTGFRYSF